MDLTWRVVGGQGFSQLADALEQRRFVGLRCPGCAKVYLPPRPACGDCRVRLEDAVEVGPEGTVETACVVHLPITDAITGEKRPVPYAMALIRLDGASTTINHYLGSEDIRPGARVRPVWRDERTGTMADVVCFERVRR